jgi:hypothetical protein
MDCDNQFDPEELAKLVPLSNAAQVIVGVRVDRADNWTRRFAGRAWNSLCRVALGVHVRDVDCGFKLLDREAISRLGLISTGACISAELCIAARHAGLDIAEVEVAHHPRTTGSPTGLRPGVALRGLWELVELRRRMGRTPKE